MARHVRRPDIVAVVTVELTQVEADFFDMMKAQLACPADTNLMRIALFNLARHCDVPIGHDVFGIRGGGQKGFRKRDQVHRKLTHTQRQIAESA